MGSLQLIRLNIVWELLDHCAPGYSRRQTDHHWQIRFAGKEYPTLPLGPHGRRKNPEIQVFHVRRMARFLGIEDCIFGALER